MSDYRIEAYKKSVKTITAKWGKEIAKLDAELGKIGKELADLEAIKIPVTTTRRRSPSCGRSEVLRKKVDSCVMNLKVNLMLIEPQPGAPKRNSSNCQGGSRPSSRTRASRWDAAYRSPPISMWT
jgi:hypothetical protein